MTAFSRSLDREVTIVPRVTSVDDRHGDEVLVDGTPFTARAMRELVAADEETSDRDQQERRYRYLIAARDPESGAVVTISGFDRLVDEGETFEIVGQPEYPTQRRRRRVHHVELVARKIGAPEVVG